MSRKNSKHLNINQQISNLWVSKKSQRKLENIIWPILGMRDATTDPTDGVTGITAVNFILKSLIT
jgi:hypothetical protein